MDKDKESVPAVSEDDLSELLDSCLDDFNKPLPKPVLPESTTKKDNVPKAKTPSVEGAKPPDCAAWSEEFKEFSDVMENIMSNDSELNEIKKMMESCLSQQGPPIDDANFAESFAESIREMTQQAQNIPENPSDDIANLLSNLGLGDGNNPDLENMPDILPLMQNIMQRLMSKDLLYPSIKEIVEKYPGWLDEKKSSLEKEEHEKYQKQYEFMKQICDEFEKEISNTEEAKKEQFEKVLILMQKVQNYGNPPKELISNISPGLPLDDQGNFQIPGMSEQCRIM
ncbi:peroxisomal biogenesis factor 19-like [Argiope bruennichi]|uniref:Peroxin-19 n=1 Tax=Argiope bruennichi TaxID=94029 RepID=A0A8T0ENZ8_ARGBR|nr:peroxisomal biogenesis factor 19-like [Argiope bruennichi]XP_055946437.1 peroxisomal biogenesis factor 19-like [Argiope bruennichi]XP_055946438.1 peroxisomal biogenesis factor 19-like [Argiope bruennichi]KAF8777091.1 Peroxisomal biogenesis factor 19 like protein [Argiope bruennichi]